MTITAIQVKDFPWYDYSNYTFSLGLKTSVSTYLSGHTASEFDVAARRIVVRGSMTEQVRTIYAKVATILEGGGLGLGDVTRIVEYVRSDALDRYAEVTAVRQELFSDDQIVVNTVPVKRLLRPEAFIEIEITALPAEGATHSAVFLPTILPLDKNGDAMAVGDVAAQTECILERASTMLKTLGLGLDRVVKTATYMTPAALKDYDNTQSVRASRLGPVFPTGVEVVVPSVSHPQALVQCDIIATREKPLLINPGWRYYDGLPLSPAVKAGKILYMSGQRATDRNTGEVLYPGDIVAQADNIYGNILTLVRAAGGEVRNIAKTIEYVTTASLDRYRDINNVRAKVLPKPLPASTGLISERLLRPEMRLDVDAIAVLD
ncbi:RidA family protein [Bradyrhizobium mercantei]|uniref:RidA family protein n=1 Tax=Bradyrhizobium mercantei TaxID=1904807 RepID=UPI0009FB4D87|nr:RidA family protein [Bradyrhizobium mercantei]